MRSKVPNNKISMTKILDIKKIEKAEVNKTEFPFFKVTNAFKENHYSKMLKNHLPEIHDGGSYPTELIKSGDSFNELIKDLKSKQLKNILAQKFNLDLQDKPAVTTFRGFSRQKDGRIHSDSKTKVLTVLVYLNEKWDARNGHLRLLYNNNDINNFLVEIQPTMGSLVAFKVQKNCWHGYENFVGRRLSLQLNYLHENSLGKHKVRHRISSIIKNIKTIFK